MIAFLSVSIGEAVILLGLVALLIDRLLDAFGKSRSSKVLRIENNDLIRRNGELELAAERCRSDIERLNRNIADLEIALETLDALRRRPS